MVTLHYQCCGQMERNPIFHSKNTAQQEDRKASGLINCVTNC